MIQKHYGAIIEWLANTELKDLIGTALFLSSSFVFLTRLDLFVINVLFLIT